VARVLLDVPERFHFETELDVRARDVNYAGHLGNDALLSLAQEARIGLFERFGFDERDVAGLGILVADAAVVYRSEAFRGERLLVRVAVVDFNAHGCDVVYLVTERTSGREVARAKTGIVFFDYRAHRVGDVPPAFRAAFAP
jgi:4-hydroxybenzoyl-CoA thioesterase